jgi:hypothetical protein
MKLMVSSSVCPHDLHSTPPYAVRTLPVTFTKLRAHDALLRTVTFRVRMSARMAEKEDTAFRWAIILGSVKSLPELGHCGSHRDGANSFAAK